MSDHNGKHKAKRAAFLAAKMGVVPAVLYFLCFCVMTYPLILFFSTHLLGDRGEALVHLWNLWWVNKAVTELHQLPWHTTYIHFPHGTTLLGHALNPLNGFMAIPLLRVMSIARTYNFLLVFSFVASGLTAFLLAYRFTKSYWGSFVGGFIFTFSSYHLAHGRGHPELCALQWIPLFLLSWYALINKPRVGTAIASAMVLLLALLSTPYYFLYSIIAAFVFLVWHAAGKKKLRGLFRREYVSALLAFLGTVLMTAGPLVLFIMLSNMRDAFVGAVPAKSFSLDALGAFIHGGLWRFSALTQAYWSKLPGSKYECTVHIGLSVTFLVVYVWTQRHKLRDQAVGLWFSLVLVFGILALGPVLHIWGKEIPFIPLPYAFLAWIFPPLRIANAPVRMMVMVSLGAGVISAYGLPLLAKRLGAKARLLILPLLLLLVVEYLPRRMPASPLAIRSHIRTLQTLPEKGGVIDTSCPDNFHLNCAASYDQIFHGKPRAFGYISRVPASVIEKNRNITRLLEQGQYSTLYNEYGFAYMVSYSALEHPSLKLLCVTDQSVYLYELGP